MLDKKNINIAIRRGWYFYCNCTNFVADKDSVACWTASYFKLKHFSNSCLHPDLYHLGQATKMTLNKDLVLALMKVLYCFQSALNVPLKQIVSIELNFCEPILL